MIKDGALAFAEHLKFIMKQQVLNGEPRDKIRLTDIDMERSYIGETIKYLLENGYIEDTEDNSVKVISESYYKEIKSFAEKTKPSKNCKVIFGDMEV